MGCCGSREREVADSVPTLDEETDVPTEIAQNLKDVPEAGSYPTSSDEDQIVVPQDRRPRLSLIPFINDVKNNATRSSNKDSPISPQSTSTSTDIIDSHMGIRRADSISADCRRSQWEAVALGIAARRRSQDPTNAVSHLRRISWPLTSEKPDRKCGAIEEQDTNATPHRNKCLANIGTCLVAEESSRKARARS